VGVSSISVFNMCFTRPNVDVYRIIALEHTSDLFVLNENSSEERYIFIF